MGALAQVCFLVDAPAVLEQICTTLSQKAHSTWAPPEKATQSGDDEWDAVFQFYTSSESCLDAHTLLVARHILWGVVSVLLVCVWLWQSTCLVARRRPPQPWSQD